MQSPTCRPCPSLPPVPPCGHRKLREWAWALSAVPQSIYRDAGQKSTNKAVSRKPPGCRSQHASWKVRLLHPLGSDPQVDQGSISPHPPQLWPEERSRDGPLLRDAPASRSPACPLSSSRSEDRCLVCERSSFRVSSGADVILLLRFRLPHPLSRCSEKVCRMNAP